MRNRLCLFLIFCSFILTASAQVQFFPPLQQAPFVVEGTPEGRLSMDVGILVIDRITGKLYAKTTTRNLNTGWIDQAVVGGGGSGTTYSFSSQFTVTATTNIALSTGEAELDLGTIANTGTATLVLATNIYRAAFSGATATIALPTITITTNSYQLVLFGTNTSGGSQVLTIPSLLRDELGGTILVTTFTNNTAAGFRIVFDSVAGVWSRVSATGDALSLGGSVTYSSVTNALSLTGSTSTFLRSDGTQATPGGGGLPASPFFGDAIYSDGTSGINAKLSSLTEFKEEFFWAQGIQPYNGWNKQSFTQATDFEFGDANHWGVIRQRSSATGVFSFFNAINHINLGAGTCFVEWICKADNVSDDTTDFILIVGLADVNNASAQTDGVYFRYNDNANGGKWLGVCESNTTESTVDTGVAFGTGWFRLGIKIVNATSAQFYINGTAAGASITTNIPNGAGRTTGIMYLMDRTLGATERNHYLDAFRLVFIPTTPR